jgi:hypothetical protein
VDQLRTLWDMRGQWESYDALVDVGAVGFRLFEEFGVHARLQPDGQAYINVPFTSDTMPAGSAQADLLRIGPDGLVMSHSRLDIASYIIQPDDTLLYINLHSSIEFYIYYPVYNISSDTG